jgi:hypothetical protein
MTAGMPIMPAQGDRTASNILTPARATPGSRATARTLTGKPSSRYLTRLAGALRRGRTPAQVAELVDAPASGAGGATREGSSPFLGTSRSDGKPAHVAGFLLAAFVQIVAITAAAMALTAR